MSLEDISIDFDLREVGRSLPRATTASGWVRKNGRKWVAIVKVKAFDLEGKPTWKTRKKVIGDISKWATKREATRSGEMARWVEEVTGQRSSTDSTEAIPQTFQAAWDEFLKHKDESGAWGAHHRELMTGLAGKWILPALGQKLLNVITPSTLTGVLNGLKVAGLSRERVIKAKQLLSMVFDYAESERWVERSPARSKHFVMPKIRQVQSPVPEPDVMARVLAALADGKYLKLRLLIRLGIQSGGRSGELRCLRWNDIREDSIRIDESWDRFAGQPGPPKTLLSAAPVAIPKSLFADLMEWKAVVNPDREESWVFPNRKSRFSRPDDFDVVLKKELDLLKNDLKADGVSLPHLNWRTMRAACATYFQSDLKSAQAQLRHARPVITATVYQRSLDSAVKSKVEEIDRMLSGTHKVPTKPARKSSHSPRKRARNVAE